MALAAGGTCPDNVGTGLSEGEANFNSEVGLHACHCHVGGDFRSFRRRIGPQRAKSVGYLSGTRPQVVLSVPLLVYYPGRG